MNMCFENVRDDHASVPRRFNVNVAISSGIKDRRHSFVIVADEIRKLSDSFSLNGFKNERHRDQLNRMDAELQQVRAASSKSRSPRRPGEGVLAIANFPAFLLS